MYCPRVIVRETLPERETLSKKQIVWKRYVIYFLWQLWHCLFSFIFHPFSQFKKMNYQQTDAPSLRGGLTKNVLIIAYTTPTLILTWLAYTTPTLILTCLWYRDYGHVFWNALMRRHSKSCNWMIYQVELISLSVIICRMSTFLKINVFSKRVILFVPCSSWLMESWNHLQLVDILRWVFTRLFWKSAGKSGASLYCLVYLWVSWSYHKKWQFLLIYSAFKNS